MTDKYIKEAYERLRIHLGHQPSRNEFLKETNVTMYWIVKSSFRTYGVLVEEMGGTAKTFLKESKSEDEFMIPYGNMITKLGRIPKTVDWIHMNCHPVASSYMRKYKLVKFSDFSNEFLKYTEGKPEWNEVVELIPVKIDSKIDLPEKETEECYVYLMFDKKTKEHKIGISNAPEWREKTLQSRAPSVKLIAAKKFVNRRIAANIEKALHESYSHKRKRGEWFQLDIEDIEEIKATLIN